MKLTLVVDSLEVVMWWIGASYNTHADCRGHSDIMMSLGWFAVLILSLNQKLNLMSFIEGELVGSHDGLMWYFGVILSFNLMDKMCSITSCTRIIRSPFLWEIMGERQAQKTITSGHIFFIKYQIDQGDMEFEYYPA